MLAAVASLPFLSQTRLSFAADPGFTIAQTAWRVDDVPSIGRIREQIVSTLAATRIEYPGMSGWIEAFYPGDAYHAVFSRDMATLGPGARYFVTPSHLRSAVEEFLLLQNSNGTENGSLPGVFTPGGGWDNASITTDEDASVIHLAYMYYRHEGGGPWLVKMVRNQSIVNRLNLAVDFLYRNRFDSATGLFKRGHTTDWGDVKMEGGANPTDIGPGDSWTASIYDQALMFRSLMELAEMNSVVGNHDGAAALRGRAATLRDATNAVLWQPERGFYRIHVHITPYQHPFDEDAILGIGNVEAIRAGLAAPDQARLILINLERAHKAAAAIKPGLVVWPPYPAGTFSHAYMGPGEYQNGGLWDWWAGRQIEAEFESGQALLGFQNLVKLTREWDKHPNNIYEWNELWSGKTRGSTNYSGAAAVVTEAVVRGLFGINMDRESWTMRPRLAGKSGAIVAHQPGTDRRLQLEVGGLSGNSVALRYDTTMTMPGEARYLLPVGLDAESVTIDRLATSFSGLVVGDDRYVTFTAPGSGGHEIALTFKPAVV